MTSGTGGEILSPTYQVVSGDLLTSQLVATEGTHGMSKVENVGSENVDNQENVKFESSENVTFSILSQAESIPPEASQVDQHSVILREALEAPQTTLKSDNFLNSVEVPPSESLGTTVHVSEEDSASQLVDPTEQESAIEKSERENYADQLSESFEDKNVNPLLEEVKHSLKRSLGEEQMVSSSSDLEDDSKRVRLDER
uniref:Uncharacterized protein n=1 Tax=Homalodisca liturata TaxID=320908 RepID=A0A1B6HPZ6_9HEMI